MLALICSNVRALGFTKVNILSPTVVAPRFVLAAVAVIAPVPPEEIAKALVRLREVIVVVAKVEVPVIDAVPATDNL